MTYRVSTIYFNESYKIMPVGVEVITYFKIRLNVPKRFISSRRAKARKCNAMQCNAMQKRNIYISINSTTIGFQL